ALTLEFGSTTLAVSTVLTVFMGGLALGSWLAGRWVDRFVNPLTRYGAIELGLALYVFLTPPLFRYVLPLFGLVGAKVGNNIWAISLLRFLVAAGLLLPPTMLMGATLPVLSRFYALWKRDAGRGAGLLYGINTLGAFVGTLAAGFLLLPRIGLSWTLFSTAGCNLILGLVAFFVGKRVENSEGPASSPVASSVVQSSAVPAPMILLAVAFTGFAAMACQVAWTRVMTLVIGASVYAFTVVLSTFLAGLGLGAAGVAMFVRSAPSRARIVFYGLALSAAIMVSLTSATFQHLPPFFLKLYWSWNLALQFDKVSQAQFLIAAAVMFGPALIMGGLFPAAARMVVQDPRQTGEKVGHLYAWNTVGSIYGSFTAGFILIPLLGIRITLLVAVAAQCAGAVVSVLGGDKKHTAKLVGGGAVVLLLVMLLTPPWHQHLMTSAMHYYASSYHAKGAEDLKAQLERQERLLYYRDGLSATITVTQDLRSRNRDLYIATNGKIDGSSHFDMPTQRLSAHIPLLFHPDPKDICVIGMGTGVTAGSASLYPVQRVSVVEIESAMVQGAKFFQKHNHAVHDSPKVNIRITDGRLFLQLHPRAFDVVVSEPSNPWLAGTSDLFTVEFFELGARALREGGIFVQWVQIYQMAPENVRTIVRTFARVFPHVYLVSTIPDTDIVLLGSKHPFPLDLGRAHRRMKQREVYQDLTDPRVGIHSIFDLAARFRMGPNEIRYFVGPGPLHTDDLPIIAYNAPKDIYRDTRKENMDLLARYARGIGPYVHGLSLSPEKRQRFFQLLASSYRAFLPGGKEAAVAERLASIQMRKGPAPTAFP
ncbi:MAG: fused MFS/spermidine synthase, partial [Candidatus Methylomirabilales bacterium]